MASRLLSVLVPVYNEEESVVASLLRILAAPLPPGVCLEIVVADDGSTDGSLEAIEGVVALLCTLTASASSGINAIAAKAQPFAPHWPKHAVNSVSSRTLTWNTNRATTPACSRRCWRTSPTPSTGPASPSEANAACSTSGTRLPTGSSPRW